MTERLPDGGVDQPAGRTRRLLIGAGGAAALAGLAGAVWFERRSGADRGQTGAERGPRAGGAPPGGGAALPAVNLGGAMPAAFWSLRFPTLDGADLALDALQGRPLLLNFWATWCPPCVREMPALDRFHRDQGAAGCRVLGLAVDQAAAVREFLVRQPVAYPVALAGLPGLQLGRQLGNDAGGLPFSVLIGADGRLIARQLGELPQDTLARWASLG